MSTLTFILSGIIMLFDSLGLSEPIMQAVKEKGYKEPSPIQAKAIPPVLEGRDVLAAAQTGTGKTAAFTLPILQKLSSKSQKGKRVIRALILTPTRELAAQIGENVNTYGINLRLQSTVIFGGVSPKPQISSLRAGLDILVATPGRLLDLQEQGFINLEHVEIFVLDEADRMLDMGFIHDIKKVMRLIPLKRQNLLFSATFSPEIKNLTQSILNDPVVVEVTAPNSTADNVDQCVYRVSKANKTSLIKHLIKEGGWKQVLVFTRTKHGANRLSEKLTKSGIPAAAIHSNKSQGARTRALAGFKAHEVRVLVATDIAARGLDIKLLPYVINFELPNIPEDYVHRIGRTARAGNNGHAISLVQDDEVSYLRGIEKLLKERIPVAKARGFVAKPEAANVDDRPPRQGQGGHARNKPRPDNRNSGSRNNGNRSNNQNRGQNQNSGRKAKSQSSQQS